MATSQKQVCLGDLKADIDNAISIGPFGSRMKADLYTPTGIPVIRGTNISDTRAWKGEFVFISEDTANSLQNCLVAPDDLVFPHRGAIGEVGIVPNNGVPKYMLSSSMMKITCDKEKADPLYLFYYFRSEAGRNEILRFASQVGTPGIGQPLTSLKSFRVMCPPLEEQRAFGKILGALDDKIELNRRMNDTLEALARAIFEAWFIDFEPVRAKMEGRWQRGESLPGLPAGISELFPDHLVKSDHGEFPEGWTMHKLGKLLELAYGKALKAEHRIGGNIPVYGSNGCVGWHNDHLATGPGIVVGRKGNPGIVTWVPTDFFPIDTTFYVVPKLPIPVLHFLFYSLRRHDLASLAADSAVPGLNRNLVYMNDQLLPPMPVLQQFENFVEQIFRRIHVADQESRTLAKIRDALLPKLISGQIAIKTAERFIERAF